MDESVNNKLKNLPSVDELARSPKLIPLKKKYSRALIIEACRQLVAQHRSALLSGGFDEQEWVEIYNESEKGLCDAIEHICIQLNTSTLRRVINATGVVVHTNLGRSPLPTAALERLYDIASGYSSLEYSVDKGERGSRHTHSTQRLKRLLGAEDSLVVNNNAAAVLVTLAALANEKEVIVSRGELVEIGGSFRIPDVMRSSGAQLVEVGTTNRTKIQDYENGVTENTALFLMVHRSNFAIVGFTESPEHKEFVRLSRKTGIPVVMDLGSGLLDEAYKNFSPSGFPEEGVRKLLETGVDLATFSGDKLLGGPQAGIIAGKANLVAKIREHPLIRAVRPCKLTLSVLDAVLNIYEWGAPGEEIPTVKMICQSIEQINSRCQKLIGLLKSQNSQTQDDLFSFHTTSTTGRVGGGASPLLELESSAVEVNSKHFSPQKIASALRRQLVPIIGRIENDQFLLDMRTVQDDELPLIINSIHSIAKEIRA